MNNMRRGFTMIELVFVIVIIGILAAVALPRFTGISEDAHVSKLQAFAGTMNRTTGATKWSSVQRNHPTANGSLGTAIAGDANATLIIEGVDVQSIPSEFTAVLTAGPPRSINLTLCAASTTDIATVEIGDNTPTTGIIATTSVIGDSTYSLGCIDSSLNNAPLFWLGKTGGTIVTR